MHCPACKNPHNKVIDSRLTESGSAIRRRRVCLDCGRRFTTKERLETELRLSVVKVDGQRVRYNRDNIFTGVERATYKLEISEAQIEEMVDLVEEEIFGHHDREVSTQDIGRYVANHLRRLDQVAYVRFMSVHRQFRTIDEFVDEIRDVRVQVAQDNPDQQSLFEG